MPPSDFPLGEEIARRTSTLRFPVAEPVTIALKIGKPVPSSTGVSAYCPFEITGPSGTPIKRAFGHDQPQSLHLALVMADADIRGYAEQTGGHLSWAGGSGTGLPSIWSE